MAVTDRHATDLHPELYQRSVVLCCVRGTYIPKACRKSSIEERMGEKEGCYD